MGLVQVGDAVEGGRLMKSANKTENFRVFPNVCHCLERRKGDALRIQDVWKMQEWWYLHR